MPLKKLVAYDLDGTLADTRKDIVSAVRFVLETMELPILPDKEIESYVGKGLHELVRNAIKTSDKKQIEKAAKFFRSYYERHMMDYTRLYEGAEVLLEHFKSRRQIVWTNKPSPFSEKMVEALGVSGYFKEVITGNGGLPKKPDPALLLQVIEKERLNCRDVLFVGDSLIDIEAGRRAGVETLIVAQGFSDEAALKEASPDYLVRDLHEALIFIRDKGW